LLARLFKAVIAAELRVIAYTVSMAAGDVRGLYDVMGSYDTFVDATPVLKVLPVVISSSWNVRSWPAVYPENDLVSPIGYTPRLLFWKITPVAGAAS
jgi:hypothetical protein